MQQHIYKLYLLTNLLLRWWCAADTAKVPGVMCFAFALDSKAIWLPNLPYSNLLHVPYLFLTTNMPNDVVQLTNAVSSIMKRKGLKALVQNV